VPTIEPSSDASSDASSFDRLADFVLASRRLVVLGGAGVSTDSGIPDYRDEDGRWKHTSPVMYQAFGGDGDVRRRYWARSMLGWRHLSSVAPGTAHHALVELERLGALHWLITQNVDGLHARAGSRRVLELHGRLAEVVCMDCGSRTDRDAFQERLEAGNPSWHSEPVTAGPDGDAIVAARDYSSFYVPRCGACGGRMKPDVVFFGESVPRERVALGLQRVGEADALLVVGSSLMVFSGFRFVREAARLNIPIAAVNLGRTRADDLFTIKVAEPCGAVLERLVPIMGAGRSPPRRCATSAGRGSAQRVAPR
jgi:NAD-dependent SIR2 family protein deacetylase